MDLLQKYGVEIGCYDPYVPVIPETREHARWAGTESIEEAVSDFDLTLVLTNHSEIDYEELHDESYCIVDTRP